VFSRKLFVGLAIAGLATAACGGSSTPAPAASAGGASTTPLTICAVENSADHPSITQVIAGMNDEAKNFNATITQLDPAADPQKQASMIQDCIAKKPTVIAVNAVDPVAVIPSLKAAHDAGIPVVMFNADTNKDGHAYTATFVGAQSYDQGYAVGVMMNAQMGGKGNVVIIQGNPGQTDVINRENGLEQAWKDVGASFSVLATQTAHWSKDEAVTVMTDFLTKYPNINAVMAQDDGMGLGALQAITAAGKSGQIKVYGVGGFTQACQDIKAGTYAGTALQTSYMIGVYTVRAAYDLSVKRLVPAQVLTPTAPVTKDNVDQWMSQCAL
jgi:ABC-type sugar transport system substrate-binding protein